MPVNLRKLTQQFFKENHFIEHIYLNLLLELRCLPQAYHVTIDVRYAIFNQ